MNQIITALVSVLLGVLLSGVGLESYKRHRDRQGAASAIAGEVFAILQMTVRRNYVPWFQGMLQQLEAGTDVKIPDVLRRPIELDPVISKYMDRLGLLGGNLPERIIVFYHYLMGIRLDLERLADDKLDADPQKAIQHKAHLIREDLALWADTATLGNALWNDLRAIALEPWWPLGKFLAMKRWLGQAPAK